MRKSAETKKVSSIYTTLDSSQKDKEFVISAPTSFAHSAHMGFNAGTGGFETWQAVKINTASF